MTVTGPEIRKNIDRDLSLYAGYLSFCISILRRQLSGRQPNCRFAPLFFFCFKLLVFALTQIIWPPSRPPPNVNAIKTLICVLCVFKPFHFLASASRPAPAFGFPLFRIRIFFFLLHPPFFSSDASFWTERPAIFLHRLFLDTFYALRQPRRLPSPFCRFFLIDGPSLPVLILRQLYSPCSPYGFWHLAWSLMLLETPHPFGLCIAVLPWSTIPLRPWFALIKPLRPSTSYSLGLVSLTLLHDGLSLQSPPLNILLNVAIFPLSVVLPHLLSSSQ